MKTTKIITHPGQAHRDEFLACCVLIAGHGNCIIERRNPTEEELNNKDIYVVDIGGRHEPGLRNFDHHQFPRDHEPTCALSLVLKDLWIYSEASDIFQWLYVTETIDSKGPFYMANELGIDPDSLFSLMSPIESQILQIFQRLGCIDVNDHLYTIMQMIGHGIMSYLQKVANRLVRLRKGTSVSQAGGLNYLDATCIPRDEDPTLGLEIFCKREINVPITVTTDDRGQGYSLFRRNDDPRVDFSRINNHPDVVFAHANGFVAKTKPNANIAELIRLSVIDSCNE